MFPKKLQRQVISQPDYPVVRTKYGKLRGLETDGAFIFRGVQYAKAARFMMPEEPDCWEGIRNARAFGATCAEVSTVIPADGFTVPHFVYPQSENCHMLNIWTPTIDPAAKKPVMLWIHGGGYQHGSSVEIFSYDGEELAKYGDVVVLSLNHRLHALGYMDLSGYDPERYRYTGNLGTADMVAALKWIKENISAFGGDPDNVMLFGQSGGAGKIQMLLQTPAADGLYHKVSMHSGVESEPGKVVTQENARVVADYVVRNLGLTVENIREIETIPFHKLATAICKAREQYQQDMGKRLNWAPAEDGDYYLGNGMYVGFREETKHIPALVGNVLGEFANNVIDPDKAEFGLKCEWDEETVAKRLKMRFGERTEEVCQAFYEAYPEAPIINTMFTSTMMRQNHIDLAKARAAAGCTVYNWLLTLELPADGGSTPWHNADEPFIFHNASFVESTYIPGVTEKLEDQMASAWVRFAYTGNPNHPGIPEWTPVTSGPLATMLFDKECKMAYGHDQRYVDIVNEMNLSDVGRNGPILSYGGGPRHPDGR